ncbi:restriction endonuclease subunit S [Providencia huaxiensis]|uniref:Restriction endonuclease subunit S n=1 Tax=Providencia huaxiensis TaxID=2027290 RepID=A0A8I2ALR8_9GAMM|nr:restriction endonuclease subunit S [Providencia huaxiensis]MBQ0266726.1 restriction endonuclease subunit S [Providencia huaxiensis]
MGSEWIQAKLGEYIESSLGKMLDQNKNTGEYHCYLGNSNVRWGMFELDNLSKMKFEAHEHIRYGIKKGDLIICEGGEPGRCAIWEDDIPNMKIQKALHRVRTLLGLDSEYLYYWFLFSTRTGRIDPFFTGTTIKHLTGKALREIPIRIPPIEYQQYGAKLLRGLDKKIILNRQINQTLEQMAQALFKSWFVDFDPVIDNALDAGFFEQDLAFSEELLRRAELRKTVRESDDFKPLSEDIRQLFPNAFEECTESTLGLGGWVPSGWELGNLSDVTDILSGFAFKSNEFQNSGFGVIKIKNIGNDKSVDICDIQRIDISLAEKAKRFSLKDGDLLMAMTGATVGKFGFLVTENQEPYYLNQRVAKFEAIDESTAYLYCILNRKITESYIVNTAQGSAQPNISAKDILAMPLITAPQSIRELFNDKTNDSFQKIIQMRKQNIILEHLRDTLLPKLISGELSLDDIKIDIPEETLI